MVLVASFCDSLHVSSRVVHFIHVHDQAKKEGAWTRQGVDAEEERVEILVVLRKLLDPLEELGHVGHNGVAFDKLM